MSEERSEERRACRWQPSPRYTNLPRAVWGIALAPALPPPALTSASPLANSALVSSATCKAGRAAAAAASGRRRRRAAAVGLRLVQTVARAHRLCTRLLQPASSPSQPPCPAPPPPARAPTVGISGRRPGSLCAIVRRGRKSVCRPLAAVLLPQALPEASDVRSKARMKLKHKESANGASLPLRPPLPPRCRCRPALKCASAADACHPPVYRLMRCWVVTMDLQRPLCPCPSACRFCLGGTLQLRELGLVLP